MNQGGLFSKGLEFVFQVGQDDINVLEIVRQLVVQVANRFLGGGRLDHVSDGGSTIHRVYRLRVDLDR